MVYIMGEQYVTIDNIYNEMLVQSVLKNRKIWFNDEVDDISCTKAIYYLEKLEKIDKINNKKEKITLVMNSPGGIVYSGLMLISKIEEMKKRGYIIETITGGMSASMSFLIGISGSKGYRKGMKYSTFLCHQPSGGVIGTNLKIKRVSDELDRLWEVSKTIIKDNTNMTDELLLEIYKTDCDYIMNSEQALSLGCIDEIL